MTWIVSEYLSSYEMKLSMKLSQNTLLPNKVVKYFDIYNIKNNTIIYYPDYHQV